MVYMKILIILAHPHAGSFNHAIADAALKALKERGHHATKHDLYAEKFDPVLPDKEIPKSGKLDPVIKKHCSELLDSDGIIIVHPNWWGQPPAILKGWIDRVIRPGIAYEFNEGDSGGEIPDGLLKGKIAIIFNTSNTPEDREKIVFGDPLDILWKNCIFDFCGITDYYRKMFSVMVTSTPDQRRIWLSDVENAVNRFFPHAYH